MTQEMMGDSDISWTICKLATHLHPLQTDNHASTSSLNFYRPDALPDAQPTVLKRCGSTEYNEES